MTTENHVVLYIKSQWIFITEITGEDGDYYTLERTIYVENIRANSALSLSCAGDIRNYHRIPDGAKVRKTDVGFIVPLSCDLSEIFN